MKDTQRKKWKRIRQSIPSERRIVAETQLFKELAKLSGPILSFYSFQDEISTLKINLHLASQNRLYLPRVHGGELKVYVVHNLDKHCTPNQWGIFEPDPSLTEETQLEETATILVPGLAFDKNFHRLGYGKGFYDRFLASLVPTIQIIGVGFEEQFSSSPLPTEPHDISLDRLLLF